MMPEHPEVLATVKGLSLDGRFLVTWIELDRVRALLHTIPDIPPISTGAIEALVRSYSQEGL